MARQPAASDFEVDVKDIGRFTFARRSIYDATKIRGRYAAISCGNYDEHGHAADMVALAMATIEVLAVNVPPSFNLNPDPLLSDDWDQAFILVFAMLREKERSFRPKLPVEREKAGQGDGELLPAVVPGQVPAGAN